MKHVRTNAVAVVLAVACALTAGSAYAWYGGPWAGPYGAGPWGWDPQEAYLDEYGFFDPGGPSWSDIRRMHRDNWMQAMGRPVHRRGVGPWGPSWTDIRRQQWRRWHRGGAWGPHW